MAQPVPLNCIYWFNGDGYEPSSTTKQMAWGLLCSFKKGAISMMSRMKKHAENNQFRSQQIEPILFFVAVAVLLALGFFSVVRGFHPPIQYGLCQWFTTYEFGFIKRGLVGTLIAPFFRLKTGVEIREMLQLAAYILLLVKLILVAFLCFQIQKKLFQTTSFTRLLTFACLCVFMSSPHMTFTAHLSGYFDHILEISTIVALLAIRWRLYFLVPLLCIGALFVHEMFSVYGLPVVGLALVLALYDKEAQRVEFPVALTTAVFAPVVVAGLFICCAQQTYSSRQFDNLYLSATQYDAFSNAGMGNMVRHLKEGVADSYRLQKKERIKRRLIDKDTAKANYPVILLFITIGGWLLLAQKRLKFFPLYFMVSLLPLATNFIAWDGARFAANTVFQSFLSLVVVVFSSRLGFVSSRCVQTVLLWLAIGVGVNNFAQSVPLMGGAAEYEGILAPRTRPALSTFRHCESIFDNSTFDRGDFHNWSSTGEVFRMEHQVIRSSVHNKSAVGGYWLLSYSRKKDAKGHIFGDRLTGRLLSVPFQIRQNRIIFRIGGGGDKSTVYTSLLIEGKEVYRSTADNHNTLTPRVWNVQKFKGKNARIVVVDNSKKAWGHIDVDQFCRTN